MKIIDKYFNLDGMGIGCLFNSMLLLFAVMAIVGIILTLIFK